MADAVDSKSTAGNCIPVQVRSPAPAFQASGTRMPEKLVSSGTVEQVEQLTGGTIHKQEQTGMLH